MLAGVCGAYCEVQLATAGLLSATVWWCWDGVCGMACLFCGLRMFAYLLVPLLERTSLVHWLRALLSCSGEMHC
jgi:hypothetical protein